MPANMQSRAQTSLKSGREKQKWCWCKGRIYLLESGKISTARSLLSGSSVLGRYLFWRCYPNAFISRLRIQASSLSLDDSFFTKNTPHPSRRSEQRCEGKERNRSNRAREASERARTGSRDSLFHSHTSHLQGQKCGEPPFFFFFLTLLSVILPDLNPSKIKWAQWRRPPAEPENVTPNWPPNVQVIHKLIEAASNSTTARALSSKKQIRRSYRLV